MKLTNQQRTIQKQFLARQKRYENKYARLVGALLAKQYRDAAKEYAINSTYTINPNDYSPILQSLYVTVGVNEAKIAWNMWVKPLTKDRKDFFDDLAALLGINVPEGEFIRIWRELMQQWLSVNILTKITEISETTKRAIAKVIEQGVANGYGAEKIARNIREQANGEINKHRSRLIARTETIGAMNRGKRMAMFTSNLKWNKRWLPVLDERTRLSHRHMMDEPWIPLEQPYWLVNKSGSLEPMNYPGDPQGSAENVCNCRCSEIYQVVRDAAGRPVRRNDLILA